MCRRPVADCARLRLRLRVEQVRTQREVPVRRRQRTVGVGLLQRVSVFRLRRSLTEFSMPLTAEHFEGPNVFVWSSQLSTSLEHEKSRETLKSIQTGKSIELWMRRRSHDMAFTYLVRVVPIRHEGSQPMLVTFRLLTPVTGELQSRLGLGRRMTAAHTDTRPHHNWNLGSNHGHSGPDRAVSGGPAAHPR